jgi:hypothetical protein
VAELSTFHFDRVFNPYSDRCLTYDHPDGPSIRRRNLEAVLGAALDGGVDAMWIGRDLGHRGGRRTGLALTDDVHLQLHAAMFGVTSVRHATVAPVMTELTARVIWRALSAVGGRTFLWNVFPFHPYEESGEFTNRKHSRLEGEAAASLLSWLVNRLGPRRIVAVGADAGSALGRLGYECQQVRHPSHGGQTQFSEGLRRIYARAV